MSAQVDLNELRNRVLTNQSNGENLPSSASRGVFVDNGGNIITHPQQGQQRQLSRVPQKTFAASLRNGLFPFSINNL